MESYKLNTLYDKIGNSYNNTRQADPFIFETLGKYLKPKTDKLYLDIGCGTGNYTILFSEKGFNFWGIDPSDHMLQQAKLKSDKINWQAGAAEKIKVKDNFFDGAIATLTIHHWADLETAFKELFRVLKDGSKMVIFTSTPEQMKGYWLNHYFPKMMKLSIDQMPAFEKIQSALYNTGFTNIIFEEYFIQDNLKDLFLYAGKNKPELYFNAEIRNGISSFSNLALKEEIEFGLKKLALDIVEDKFKEIGDKFENDLGDYIFISAEKE